MTTYIGRLDVFDPGKRATKSGGYAGEIVLCAVTTDNMKNGLVAVFEDLEANDIVVRTIDFFGVSNEYSDDTRAFGVAIDDLVEAAVDSGQIVYSDTLGYEKDL